MPGLVSLQKKQNAKNLDNTEMQKKYKSVWFGVFAILSGEELVLSPPYWHRAASLLLEIEAGRGGLSLRTL